MSKTKMTGTIFVIILGIFLCSLCRGPLASCFILLQAWWEGIGLRETWCEYMTLGKTFNPSEPQFLPQNGDNIYFAVIRDIKVVNEAIII